MAVSTDDTTSTTVIRVDDWLNEQNINCAEYIRACCSYDRIRRRYLRKVNRLQAPVQVFGCVYVCEGTLVKLMCIMYCVQTSNAYYVHVCPKIYRFSSRG